MFDRIVEIDRVYQESIDEGLDDAYENCKNNKINLDIAKDKIIIFSDQHRGVRDGADDFVRCEKAYNAALGYYLEAGYTLIILGDAEELWECRPEPVVRAYKDTLSLEAAFLKQNRYYRIYGNHDDYWEKKEIFEKYLKKERIIPQLMSVPVLRGIILVYNPTEKIFLVHGHQGTFDSDKLRPISKFFVRYIWRNIQRRLGIKLTTPAKDVSLKSKHDLAMYSWAINKCKNNEKLILIAGHTHLPVFASINYIGKLEDELKRLHDDLRLLEAQGSADVSDLLTRVAEKRAKLEFVKAKGEGKGFEMEKPCYFNTGCCSYSDGDVTGIEISNGKISLVRWPDDQGNPMAKILEYGNLDDIFQSI
ncbi:MAG: metallophosphoesterase [Nitrospirota bacterium]